MQAFTATNSSVSVKARDVVTSALREIGAIGPGETPSAEDAGWVLEKLQRLIDQTNARREMIYSVAFTVFVLQANHSPHTIGPGGDFQLNLRPVRLMSAALVLNSGTAIDLPINVRGPAWWAAQTVKAITATIPTDVYYSPDYPLGNLYFWPVPTQANNVRLETWVNLTQAIDLDTNLAMPPAYWNYIVLTLAKDIVPSYPEGANLQLLLQQQREAAKAVTGNNNPAPRLNLAAGVPSESTHGHFDFYTGKPW